MAPYFRRFAPAPALLVPFIRRLLPPVIVIEAAYMPVNPREVFPQCRIIRVDTDPFFLLVNYFRRTWQIVQSLSYGRPVRSLLRAKTIADATSVDTTGDFRWSRALLYSVVTFPVLPLVFAVRQFFYNVVSGAGLTHYFSCVPDQIVDRMGDVTLSPGVNFILAAPCSGKTAFLNVLPSALVTPFQCDEEIATVQPPFLGLIPVSPLGQLRVDFFRSYVAMLLDLRRRVNQPLRHSTISARPASTVVDLSSTAFPGLRDPVPCATIQRAVCAAVNTSGSSLAAYTVSSMIANLLDSEVVLQSPAVTTKALEQYVFDCKDSADSAVLQAARNRRRLRNES